MSDDDQDNNEDYDPYTDPDSPFYDPYADPNSPMYDPHLDPNAPFMDEPKSESEPPPEPTGGGGECIIEEIEEGHCVEFCSFPCSDNGKPAMCLTARTVKCPKKSPCV